MTSKKRYYIFEFEKYGVKEELLFDSQKYFNEELTINTLSLLHIHFEDRDYFLLLGYGRNRSSYSFQYNKGNEFTDFLINHGVSYYRYDAISVEGYWKFKLNNGQIIQLDTYATGQVEGLEVFDVSNKNNKTRLLSLPMGKLKLDKTDRTIKLQWEGEAENDNLPKPFQRLIIEQEKAKKYAPFYSFIFILILILIFYLIGEFINLLF